MMRLTITGPAFQLLQQVAHGDRQQLRSTARPSVTWSQPPHLQHVNLLQRSTRMAAMLIWRHLAAGRPPQGGAAEQRVPGAHGPGRRIKLRRV